MTVNLRSIPTQVIIGGATDLDVSQSFVSLSLSSGVWDEGGWWKLRGTLTLAGFVRGYSESFAFKPLPRKGTETSNWSAVRRFIVIKSFKPLPRKGTETLLV